MLRGYARYVREQHLTACAEEELRLLRQLNAPLLNFMAQTDEAALLAQTKASVERFLRGLEAGTALEDARASLAAWEADRLPGIPREAIQPSDLVRIYTAQREAVLSWLPHYTPDVAAAVAIVREIEDHYVLVQEAAFEVYVKLMRKAESELVRTEGAHSAMTEHASMLEAELIRRREAEAALRQSHLELQDKTELLQVQAEELENQQEELELLTESLRESNRRLEAEGRRAQSVVNSALDAIVTMDEAGVVLQFNPAAEQLFGYARAEALGRKMSELIVPPAYREAHERGMQRYLATRVPHILNRRLELVGMRKDESEFPMELTVTSVPVEGGAVFTAYMRDITERREAEARRAEIETMRQADALKDQFLSILSHELRTPINAIMGFGSILDDELAGGLNAQQHDYLRKMLSGAEMLLSLVNDLLDISRIQAGKFSLDPRPMRLQDVASDVLVHLSPLAEQRHHRLKNELDPNLPTLQADAQRVSQVLVNLVGNAIKFTPEGGIITVRARIDGAMLRCEVQDNGPGIRPEDQLKLFRPFTQLGAAGLRKVPGTGLGLSISKALIEAHGGQIGVDSEPGRGSTFWIALPLMGPGAGAA